MNLRTLQLSLIDDSQLANIAGETANIVGSIIDFVDGFSDNSIGFNIAKGLRLDIEYNKTTDTLSLTAHQQVPPIILERIGGGPNNTQRLIFTPFEDENVDEYDVYGRFGSSTFYIDTVDGGGDIINSCDDSLTYLVVAKRNISFGKIKQKFSSVSFINSLPDSFMVYSFPMNASVSGSCESELF